MNDNNCVKDGIRTESDLVKKSGRKQQADFKYFF